MRSRERSSGMADMPFKFTSINIYGIDNINIGGMLSIIGKDIRPQPPEADPELPRVI